MQPIGSMLLCLACLIVLSSALPEQESYGRHLLQKSKKELRNEAREEDALEAYYLQQATLNKEQESLLRFGSEEAVTIVRKLEKSDRKKQVAILADLWANAKGITIVKSLAILIDLRPKKVKSYYALNSDAMDQAEDQGYTFKVSEALYNALAVTDSSSDHYHLLDALLYRMEQKNNQKKGSGCQYIEFLFTDAEAWAINDGRAQHFFRGFDSKDYIEIAECFLPVCKGSAAKCCGSSKAISTGLCQCKVINKKEGTMQCEHNLFWTAPRTIWLCGTQDCQPDEKCLCAEEETGKKKNKKTTGKASSKTDRKGKKQANDEEDEKDESKKGKQGGKKMEKSVKPDEEPKKSSSSPTVKSKGKGMKKSAKKGKGKGKAST